MMKISGVRDARKRVDCESAGQRDRGMQEMLIGCSEERGDETRYLDRQQAGE
jgi:hypothetical protein